VQLLGACVALLGCSGSSASVADAPAPVEPLPASEGQRCSADSSWPCLDGLVCREQPIEVRATSEPGEPTPAGSGPGGPCGGVLGHRCQEPLICTMSRQQAMVPDGMGTCGGPHVCTR